VPMNSVPVLYENHSGGLIKTIALEMSFYDVVLVIVNSSCSPYDLSLFLHNLLVESFSRSSQFISCLEANYRVSSLSGYFSGLANLSTACQSSN